MSDAWKDQVLWMRQNGVVRARFSPTGQLEECELAPMPPEPGPPIDPKLAEEARLKAAQDYQDLLDFGASGG